jgi:hypothetical protein
VTEKKLPSLAAKVAAADRRQVAVEEQCEHLVHKLTLLNLRGSARFQERAEWCSCPETFGSRVCDLVLGPANGRVHLAARLEEVARKL